MVMSVFVGDECCLEEVVMSVLFVCYRVWW